RWDRCRASSRAGRDEPEPSAEAPWSRDHCRDVWADDPLNAASASGLIKLGHRETAVAPGLAQRLHGNVDADAVTHFEEVRYRLGDAVDPNALPLDLVNLNTFVKGSSAETYDSQPEVFNTRGALASLDGKPNIR